MKQTVTYPEIGQVIYSKTQRNKNFRIRVFPDNTVKVSVPFLMKWKDAEKLVFENKQFVIKRQTENNAKRQKIDFNTIFKTYQHQISLKKEEKININQKDKKIVIGLPEVDTPKSSQIIEDVVVQIYKWEAKSILPQKVEELAKQFGFKYQQVKIRDNRSIWGSCSYRKIISLNAQLMKLPIHLIDYVILHELTHTEIRNHSQKFWNRLNQVTQNKAIALDQEIKEYSTFPLLLKKSV